jgi:hypothetical protein
MHPDYLRKWPPWVRGLLVIVITVIVVCLILFFLPDATGEEQPPFTQWEDRLLALDVEAIDSAYRTHVSHLFEVWMKDATGQPQRAVVGVRSARRAYIQIMQAIETRRNLRPRQ